MSLFKDEYFLPSTAFNISRWLENIMFPITENGSKVFPNQSIRKLFSFVYSFEKLFVLCSPSFVFLHISNQKMVHIFNGPTANMANGPTKKCNTINTINGPIQ